MHNIDQQILELRKEFPMLQQKMNGHPLIYFDHAATTLKPTRVILKEQEYYQQYGVNVHRGSYSLCNKANTEFEHAREVCAKFLNAQHQEIVFTSGTTHSINFLALNLASHILQPGDRILISVAEHHANMIAFQEIAKQHQLLVEFIPLDESGELDLKVLEEKLTPPTKFLALTGISNVLGIVNPIESIIQKAHQNNILVHIDAAQMVAHRPIDVQALDIDFLSFSGHKIFAPTGVGVFFAKSKYLELFTPFFYGGGMVHSVSCEAYTLKSYPTKFEAGTPPIAQVIGLGEALQFVLDIGWTNLIAIENYLLAYADTLFDSLFPEIFVYGKEANDRIPIYSFHTKNIHPHDVATFLDDKGIAVRTGKHCAHPLLNYFKVGSLTRAALGLTNTTDELDQLKTQLIALMEFFMEKDDRLKELYHLSILEYSRTSAFEGVLDHYTNTQVGFNPSCGDKIVLYLQKDQDRIQKIRFVIEGCAICRASSYLIAQMTEGETIQATKTLLNDYFNLIMGKPISNIQRENLGELDILKNLHQYPVRVKCGSLFARTLESLLENPTASNKNFVSTEE